MRVIGVAPGILEATGLRTLAYEEALAYTRGISVDDLRRGYASTKTTPLERSGKLTEVADLVVYLASERALHPRRHLQRRGRQDARLNPKQYKRQSPPHESRIAPEVGFKVVKLKLKNALPNSRIIL